MNDDDDDPLGTARGMCVGLLIAAAMWAVAGVMWWLW